MIAYPLISTIVFSVVFAFILGYIACKLRLPSIIGYLIAGIFLSPHTPGITADVEIAKQLAEIGIILLMFDVGLHFSMKDLLKVKNVAIIGSLFQMIATALFCTLIGLFFKFNLTESIIYGICLSVASTVVMIRGFEQYRLQKTQVAKIATGWLIIEDIIMIVILFIIPIIASNIKSGQIIDSQEIFYSLSGVLVKVVIFVIAMLTFGKKILPAILVAIYKTHSRELVSLSILAIACGFAFIAHSFFQTSFALGAFIAGFVLNESKIGIKTVEKSVSLRDIFAVLFFVSVGLIFNPEIIFQKPLLILSTVFLIIFIKSFFSFLILFLLKKPIGEILVLSASLSQIGEFSFILVVLCSNLGLISKEIYDVVISSAVISITLNPFIFKACLKNYSKVG